MIFVDSSAWYALMVPDDESHREARAYFRTLSAGGAGRLLTSDYVLAETYTLLRYRKDVRAVRQFVEVLGRSKYVERAWVSPEDHDRALRIMCEGEDKEWSFTDCTSFILMRALGVDSAFTFDSGFAQAGFRVNP